MRLERSIKLPPTSTQLTFHRQQLPSRQHFTSLIFSIPKLPPAQPIKMQFQLTTITFALLAALATAAPAELEMRQSGGYYHAVGYKYSGGGCTPTTENNGDPIFGTGGYCQALNRYITPTTPPITSYKLSSLADGCTGRFFLFLVNAAVS